MKYYQHGDTGRVVATENELSGEWYEIEENQYKEILLTDLEKRVQQFNSLSLPGQGFAMHMGTSYLVNDLFREVQRLRALESRSTQDAADLPKARSFSVTCPNCGTFIGVDFAKSASG